MRRRDPKLPESPERPQRAVAAAAKLWAPRYAVEWVELTELTPLKVQYDAPSNAVVVAKNTIGDVTFFVKRAGVKKSVWYLVAVAHDRDTRRCRAADTLRTTTEELAELWIKSIKADRVRIVKKEKSDGGAGESKGA